MNADQEQPGAQLTGEIIKVFYEVYNELGVGFLESIYENAMVVALAQAGLPVSQQVPCQVIFRGKIVGEYRIDLLVAESVIVETKAVNQLLPVHEAQLVNYLKATGHEIGLLLNFGPTPQVKRKIFSRKNLRSSA
jgi:GxxExxY protein